MAKHTHSLDEKFDLALPRQLLTGAQAIVRLVLMQKARDRAAGLNTAGYVSGYRGSPIAGLEGAFERARRLIAKNDIVFQPGLNEDLAATAVWGSQQAELRGEGKYDGVFAVWYGKGPGVDRTGDAFRHGNHAGTSKHGGVLALLGDDHTCESSTCAHQSEFAMVDCMMPILNPAGVQELLDYGLLGFALSRYAGAWVGLKCVKDNIESTATVDGDPDRVQIRWPSNEDFGMPPGGLNIRLGDSPLDKERRLHGPKLRAMTAFARANKLDHLVTSGGATPKIGIITTGKSYLDTRAALDALGIDEVRANELGLRIYKVGMVWPLEPQGLRHFAEGLELIIVIEEKRALIEMQLKEQLFDSPRRPIVVGKRGECDEVENREWLLPPYGALDPTDIAIVIGERLAARGCRAPELTQRIACLTQLKPNSAAVSDAFARTPYFCAGCPHNSSTKVPEDSRAYAGIGCHYMVQWMERATDGFTQMGGEGANWIGEAPFSKRQHVFQNIGDGTYIHSGSLAIRAAIAAGTRITYKLLYNDAVAMTGGQKLDSAPTVGSIAAEMIAQGVERCVVVTDEPEKYPSGSLPAEVTIYHRRDLIAVEKELAALNGVTLLIYDQTCAAEKRRRRKRGLFPDPDKRVFINAAVCEGCGDCGVKSNCVAILPLATEFGRKRQIDQSACNKDFSCVEGFCPSFVTLHGAKPRRIKQSALGLPTIPEPSVVKLGERPYSIIVNGVGGTGVVTVSAVLAQAAHMAGLQFGAIDMTGMAQKGGAVACHIQIAGSSGAIHAIRVSTGGADLVLGGDLVVTASSKILDTLNAETSAVVCSTHEMITGDFARKPNLTVPGAELKAAIQSRVRREAFHTVDAHDYAARLFGDTIMANMFLVGFAYQLALLPIKADFIEEAIALNGAAVDANALAFRFGRLAAYDRAELDRITHRELRDAEYAEPTLQDVVSVRSDHLTRYQSAALAERYRKRVAIIADIEATKTPGMSGLVEAVARSYHKLLAIKDEYEVARLFTDGNFEREVSTQFDGYRGLHFHLAPPFLATLYKDKATGHPRKIALPGWLMLPVFRTLAKAKCLRGTRLDAFGWTQERRLERQMIADYEAVLDQITMRLTPATHAMAVELALQGLDIKGFGHVKRSTYESVKAKRGQLLVSMRELSCREVMTENSMTDAQRLRSEPCREVA